MKKLVFLILCLVWLGSSQAQEIPFKKTLSGHSYGVNSVSFSPDGKYLASGSSDKTIKLWDVASGICLKTLSGHSGVVYSVSFSPDGKYLASGSADKTIKLWDVASGRNLQTLRRHSGSVESVSFSPDGKYLASGSYDNTIKLWDVASGRNLQTLSGHSSYVESVSFSPDGKYLASGSYDNTIKLWDVASGTCLQTLSGHSGSVESVSFSPDGKNLASGSSDETIKLWDVASGTCLQTLSGHSGSVESVSFSPDGNYLASGSFDKTIKLWDVASGTILQTLSGHSDWVLSVSFSPDGKYLASGSSDNIIKLWDMSNSITPKPTIPLSQQTPKSAKPTIPPLLSLSQLQLQDENGNNAIDANETCYLSFVLSNSGKGEAMQLKAKLHGSAVAGLSYAAETPLENLKPGESKSYKIPLKTQITLASGIANLNLSFYEPLGFQPEAVAMKLTTVEFSKPAPAVADHSFSSETGKLQLASPISLAILVQNQGVGIAEDVKVSFGYPNQNIFATGNESVSVGTLLPGASKKVEFSFIANRNYSSATIPISVTIAERFGKFGETKTFTASLNQSSDKKIYEPVANVQPTKPVVIENVSLTSDVDKDIPVNAKNGNRVALIIGNEDYQSYQTGLSSEQNVPFALRDATVFKEYAIKTLGVEEGKCIFIKNGTAGQMKQQLTRAQKIAETIGKDAELIIYYAGHGFPDENTKVPYILPVDISASDLTSAINVSALYKDLGALEIKISMVILDACFSGGARGSGLTASRTVKINPEVETLGGNLVVLAATTDEQTALPYKQQQHGMFTYYLLKKLKETKGEVTYKDLNTYLSKEVNMQSLIINQKEQQPTMLYSPSVEQQLNQWKIK